MKQSYNGICNTELHQPDSDAMCYGSINQVKYKIHDIGLNYNTSIPITSPPKGQAPRPAVLPMNTASTIENLLRLSMTIRRLVKITHAAVAKSTSNFLALVQRVTTSANAAVNPKAAPILPYGSWIW